MIEGNRVTKLQGTTHTETKWERKNARQKAFGEKIFGRTVYDQ
jgi:hypothetical protein